VQPWVSKVTSYGRPTERLRIQKEKEKNVQIERENKERVRETEGKRD